MESASRAKSQPELVPWKRHTLLLALCTVIICAICWYYPQVMGLIGIGTGGIWFRDTQAVLYALDIHRQGLNPYGAVMRHNYSHWWFWLDGTGLSPRATLGVGFVIDALALLAGWWVTRPRSASEVGWALAVFCSAPMLLGLNRGNVDLLLFALLCGCVPCVLSRVRFWRVAGAAGLLALGLGLKYYPIIGAPVLLAVRPARDRLLACGLAVLLFALTILNILPDLLRFGGVVDHAGFYLFGVPSFFAKLGQPAALGLGVAVVGLLAAGFWLFRRTALRTWTVPAGLRFEYLNFIFGACILTGCFLLADNYAYRWIFALLLLAFLGRLDALPLAPAVRHLKNSTRLLLVAQLWIEPFVVANLNLHPRTLEQLIWWEQTSTMAVAVITWALFVCLATWLVHFAATQLRAGAEAAGRPRPPA